MKLLSSLSVGQKIKVPVEPIAQPYFGTQLIFVVADKNHSGYPVNSVTLVTDRIERLICTDEAEPSSMGFPSTEGWSDYLYTNRLRYLNSDATSNWYYPTHSNDAPPATGNYAYSTEPGFLAALGPKYEAAILETDVPYLRYDIYGNVDDRYVSAKVYDLSVREVSGYGDAREGAQLALFSTTANRVRYPSSHCVALYGGFTSGLSTSKPREWSLRSPSSLTKVSYITTSGAYVTSPGYTAKTVTGLICAHNLPGDQAISDTPDADGYYSVLFNYAPTPPDGVIAPPTTYVGQPIALTWGASQDPEGDSITYHIERAVNGAAYAFIGQTVGLSYTDTVQTGWADLRYRVRAVDAHENTSAYTLSNAITVLINEPPVISGSNTDLGVKTAGFSYTYSIADAEDDAVTVAEVIDEVVVRTFQAELGSEYSFDVKGDAFTALAYGSHTLRITATDAVNNISNRILAFAKESNYLEVSLKQPITTSSRPVRVNIDVKRDIPAGASFRVWATNNPYDPTPVWEDCTLAVRQGTAHIFTNTVNAALEFGLNIRVKAQRHTAIGPCWVSGISGNIDYGNIG